MVKKKIFDINPAKQGDLQKKKLLKKIRVKSAIGILSARRTVPLFAGLCLLAGLVLSYFLIPPKADIKVWPKKENIEGKAEVTVAVNKKDGSYISGKIIESEKIISENFSAQGTVLKATKAQGTIRVYNAYSAASQTLVASTRFVSDDGKLFRTPSRVVVPGASYAGSKLVPGFVDVKVAADQPGEEYNIDSSTFSIPGFSGTPKYTSFYAKSSEPMTGGMKTEVPRVTSEDLERAKKSLTERALMQSNADINNTASSGGYAVINEAISSEVLDFTASAKEGQEVKDFSAQIKTLTKSLVFLGDELKSFAGNYIEGKISQNKNFIESSLRVEYALKAVNLEKGELNLNLAVFGQTHSFQEAGKIKELVAGKKVKEVERIIKDFQEIEKSRIEFWPFWARFAPKDLDRIKINLLLD